MKKTRFANIPRAAYVGFANAKLPDSDYRVSFARDSDVSDVYLALPGKPRALPRAKYIPLNIGEGLHFSTLFALLRIPVILHRSRADIAHFFATQLALAGPLLARLSGARSIITITGRGRTFDRAGRSGTILKSLYMVCFRMAAGCSEAILFQNEDDLRELSNHVPARTRRKFKLIGSAIDDSLFDAPRPRPEGRPVCVMVARIHASKGISDFLNISRDLHGQADFVLVGPPSVGAEELLADVHRAAADGALLYEGQKEDWEVRDLLGSATVLVIASRGEGIPRVVLEASLSGAAAIGYDIAGCKATLPAAALAPAFDSAALGTLVQRALSDVGFRAALVEDAREIVTERFSARTYARNLDSVISSALKR